MRTNLSFYLKSTLLLTIINDFMQNTVLQGINLSKLFTNRDSKSVTFLNVLVHRNFQYTAEMIPANLSLAAEGNQILELKYNRNTEF